MKKISMLNLPVGIFKIDHDKKMLYVNKHFCKISGRPKAKLLGDHWRHVIHQEDMHHFISALTKSMDAGIACEFEFRFMGDGGSETWVLCNAVPEKASKTAVDYIGTITNITELKKTQGALQNLARFDPVTQLPNRYLFEDLLTKSLLREKRRKDILAVFYIDVDYFKNVNDFYGHGVGDAFLKEVGVRLKQSVRTEDLVVRLGGDEFAVILEDIYSLSATSLAAKRLIDEFQKPFTVGEHEIISSLSIGISVYPDEGTTPDTIVQHADQALYQAKQAGRNCYRYYNRTMQQVLDRCVLIITQLRNAVKENQFELHYQPKVDAQTTLLVGMEALLRWNNPLVNASPDEFVTLAEDAGLMNEIGAWVIKAALEQYKEWYDSINKVKNVSISVNLSPSQLGDSKIIETVTQALRETDIPAHNILFELTETTVMKKAIDSKTVLQVFLTELGIGISIDDFGTGYSSLTYLKLLPIKELKIDKSFIDDIGKNNNSESIIKAIINLAISLDLQVTAEGVETKQQLDFLKENGCGIIQGYYFSKPLNVADMTAYIGTTM